MALRSHENSAPNALDSAETSGASDTARTPGFDRRTLVKGAAWSVPVIALAVGAPAQASSGSHWTPCICGGKNGSGPYGQNDNGEYLVEQQLLIITYDRLPQNQIDVNVNFLEGGSHNFHYTSSNWPLAPGSKTLTIDLSPYTTKGPSWIQVDGFNSHYSDPKCPAPSTNH